jgi:hypothetical protein
VAILAATAAVALAYPRLRSGFQDRVDRRWFPSRHSADKALEAFAEGIRDEVDEDRLRDRLHDAVEDTVGPESVGLWLAQPRRAE